MGRHVLVVLSNAVQGRDDEFNRWYDDVHLGEVLSIPGFVAAQRFETSAPVPNRAASPHRYLALYEIEADDVDAPLEALSAGAKTMNMSDALDRSTVAAYAFTERGARKVSVASA